MAGTLEAVEDQVEPELELVTVVVARLQDVLDGDLGEVGYSPEANCAIIACTVSAEVWNGRLGSCRANR